MYNSEIRISIFGGQFLFFSFLKQYFWERENKRGDDGGGGGLGWGVRMSMQTKQKKKAKKMQILECNSLGRIDLKSYTQIFTGILHILIYPRRAETIFDPLVFRVGIPSMLVPIGNLEMNRLILFMIGSCSTHAGQDVKGNPVVGFGVFDFVTLIGAFGGGVVRPFGFQGPRRSALKNVRFQTGIQDTAIKTERGMKGGSIVSDVFQFFPDRTVPQRIFVVV